MYSFRLILVEREALPPPPTPFHFFHDWATNPFLCPCDVEMRPFSSSSVYDWRLVCLFVCPRVFWRFQENARSVSAENFRKYEVSLPIDVIRFWSFNVKDRGHSGRLTKKASNFNNFVNICPTTPKLFRGSSAFNSAQNCIFIFLSFVFVFVQLGRNRFC